MFFVVPDISSQKQCYIFFLLSVPNLLAKRNEIRNCMRYILKEENISCLYFLPIDFICSSSFSRILSPTSQSLKLFLLSLFLSSSHSSFSRIKVSTLTQRETEKTKREDIKDLSHRSHR